MIAYHIICRKDITICVCLVSEYNEMCLFKKDDLIYFTLTMTWDFVESFHLGYHMVNQIDTVVLKASTQELRILRMSSYAPMPTLFGVLDWDLICVINIWQFLQKGYLHEPPAA